MDSSAFYKRWRESLQGAGDGYRGRLEGLEAGYEETLRHEESRILRHVDDLIDAAGRAEAARLERTMDRIEAQVGERPGTKPSLDSLDVRTLHMLARLDSALRHSIVEACLMNLRAVADVLDERLQDPEFVAKMKHQAGLVPGVVKQVLDFFKRPVFVGVSIRDLMPLPCKAAFGAIDGLLATAHYFQKRGAGDESLPVTGKQLASQVDELTRALGEVRRVLDERRTSLARAARSGVDVLRPTLEARGVEITFVNETDGMDRLYLDASGVANAVGEVVRNALRHGLENGARGGWILVRVVAGAPPSTELRIVVENPGNGPLPEVVESAGRHAVSTSGGGAGLPMVRGIVEDHFGRLEIAPRPEGGALVTLVFPRHMPREESTST